MEERLRSQRASSLAREQALEQEVLRLRGVQEDVLVQGGALPGGEVRQYLFLEATKTRKLLQPGTTISWRGQQEDTPLTGNPRDKPAGASPTLLRTKHGATANGAPRSPRRPESARQTQPRAPPFGVGY